MCELQGMAGLVIETFLNLRCDDCNDSFIPGAPWREEDNDTLRRLMRTAELAGWKVNRLAQDAYYGKAWCTNCREDRCLRCWGRGYYPKWPLNEYGELERKECEVCNGKGF